MNMVSYQNDKIYKITHDSCTKCCIIEEAHAQHYLKECQGIELQKVQVLIPTTSILNVHCTIEPVELHPSDNREAVLHQECIQKRNMTPHHQENCVAVFLFPPKGRSHDVHVAP